MALDLMFYGREWILAQGIVCFSQCLLHSSFLLCEFIVFFYMAFCVVVCLHLIIVSAGGDAPCRWRSSIFFFSGVVRLSSFLCTMIFAW